MNSASSGLGRKIFLALFLALIVGYFWACFESGRNPFDVLHLFASKDPAKPTDARKPSRPKPDLPRPVPPPAPRPETPELPTPSTARPPATAPKPSPNPLSGSEVTTLFTTLDDQFRRGKIFEARSLLQNMPRARLPEDAVARFAEAETRVGKYCALVQETTRGILIEMPRLSAVLLKTGGKLVVKVLSDTSSAVLFESITGIRGRIARADIESMEDLKPAYAAAEIKLELLKKAGYLGLKAFDNPGQPLSYKDIPNRPRAGGAQIFFDLADFCARNGANDKLVPLFDEALQRDPDLLVTVHDAKADRLINVLLYYLGINSGADAKLTLELLKEKYSDTKAFRERVTTDVEVTQMTDLVVSRRTGAPPSPMAKADPANLPAPKPLPDSGARTEPKEIERAPSAGAPAEPTTMALPEGTPSKVRDYVSRGDRHFVEAMKHLQNSDPNINPDGWAAENRKALECFLKANQEGYIPAQDEYGKGGVPHPLLDRVRETTMRSSLCRKRSVRK